MKIKDEDKFNHLRADGLAITYDSNAKETTIKAFPHQVQSQVTVSNVTLLKDSTGKIVGIKIPD